MLPVSRIAGSLSINAINTLHINLPPTLRRASVNTNCSRGFTGNDETIEAIAGADIRSLL